MDPKETISNSMKDLEDSIDTMNEPNDDMPDSTYMPEIKDNLENKAKAEAMKGARDFQYTRKISLSNYDPRRKFETEDFACMHDSFEEARAVVQGAVEQRISELRGVKEMKTKE